MDHSQQKCVLESMYTYFLIGTVYPKLFGSPRLVAPVALY